MIILGRYLEFVELIISTNSSWILKKTYYNENLLSHFI